MTVSIILYSTTMTAPFDDGGVSSGFSEKFDLSLKNTMSPLVIVLLFHRGIRRWNVPINIFGWQYIIWMHLDEWWHSLGIDLFSFLVYRLVEL